MKEKIEEIVNKKLAYCPVEGNSDIYRVHRYRVEELKGEISTLIQEERKDAIEGFAKWIRPNCDYDLGDFEGYAKEYLESEGK
jgi:hypothetical protein